MALNWYTTEELIEIEDNLRLALAGLQEIRQICKDSGAEAIQLNASTAAKHAKWLKKWSSMEPVRTKERIEEPEYLRMPKGK